MHTYLFRGGGPFGTGRLEGSDVISMIQQLTQATELLKKESNFTPNNQEVQKNIHDESSVSSDRIIAEKKATMMIESPRIKKEDVLLLTETPTINSELQVQFMIEFHEYNIYILKYHHSI